MVLTPSTVSNHPKHGYFAALKPDIYSGHFLLYTLLVVHFGSHCLTNTMEVLIAGTSSTRFHHLIHRPKKDTWRQSPSLNTRSISIAPRTAAAAFGAGSLTCTPHQKVHTGTPPSPQHKRWRTAANRRRRTMHPHGHRHYTPSARCPKKRPPSILRRQTDPAYHRSQRTPLMEPLPQSGSSPTRSYNTATPIYRKNAVFYNRTKSGHVGTKHFFTDEVLVKCRERKLVFFGNMSAPEDNNNKK